MSPTPQSTQSASSPQNGPHVGKDEILFKQDGWPRFTGCSKVESYEFLEKLGEGTFGEVYKARSRKDGHLVALKKILMHNEKDGFPITALREIKLLKMLSHPNILKLEEMAVERPKKEDVRKRAAMHMVTPYMDHDLSGLLENPSVNFTVPQIKCYLLQLLEGLRYLHSQQILHRDMKAANLLINNHGILQIADFGLARPYRDPPPTRGSGGGESSYDYTSLVVTRWYRPPELLLGLRRYTTAIDMWGVGCVFAEMFRRQPIMRGQSDLKQAYLIFNLVGNPTEETMPGWSRLPGCDGVKSFEPSQPKIRQAFKDIGPSAISLLEQLLKLDWRTRITAIDALEHPYFKTEPLPAKPSDLPTFEQSHELDRRKFRSQQQPALPPAPAGGAVGMGPEGEWATGAQGMHSGRPPPRHFQNNYRNDRHDRYDHHDRRHHRPHYDRDRPAIMHSSRPPTSSGLPPPPTSLPARPNWAPPQGAAAEHHPGAAGWLNPNDSGPPLDYGGGPEPHQSRVGGRGPPRRGPPQNLDTYVPSYDGAPPRRDERRVPAWQMERGRHSTPRTDKGRFSRSRSPNWGGMRDDRREREGSHGIGERDPYARR